MPTSMKMTTQTLKTFTCPPTTGTFIRNINIFKFFTLRCIWEFRGKLGTRWATTQEDTPVSGTEVLFKLFDILEMEFDVGHVCKDCYHLLEQLDSFQFQFACLKEKLMAR